jgi:protein-S-isoprenylcysteine O-methyltransferase Ste14
MGNPVVRSKKVNSKVKAGGIAGTILTAVVLVLGLLGVQVPADVQTAVLTIAAAVMTVVHFVTSYLKTEDH